LKGTRFRISGRIESFRDNQCLPGGAASSPTDDLPHEFWVVRGY